MNRTELVRFLDVLSEARKRLIEDFISENPDLYHSMFKHKARSADMDICISIYFYKWLDRHLAIYKNKFLCDERANNDYEDDVFSEFLLAYRRLCDAFITNQAQEVCCNKSRAFDFLVKQRIELLGQMQAISNNSHERAKTLEYQSTKAERIFQRTIKNSLEKINDC